MIVPVEKLFTPEAAERIAEIIEKNDGCEVAIGGYVDRDGLVADIEVIAYGGPNAAPVVLADALKADVLIHNHPGNIEDPDLLRASEADIGMASDIAALRIGFYIVDNELSRVNVITPAKVRYTLPDKDVLDIFDDGGLLSKHIAHFEPRAEQIDLVAGMVEAVNGSKLLVSEAGTGTGKSLSYLIPTAVWAVKNGKRVIVSTQTINLQQQIFQKDMPLVAEIVKQYTGQDVPYALLIGRGNYLCKKKLYEFLRDRERHETLFDDTSGFGVLEELEVFSRNAQDGTLAEFGGDVPSELWEEISCASDGCPKRKCPFYSECFYYRARLLAEKANIIVGNHSLLFASIDAENRRSRLPFFSGIVLDEAHHAEDVALKAMSQEFSFQGLLYQLRRLYAKKGERSTGLLLLLERRGNFQGHPEMREDFQQLLALSLSITNEIRAMVPELGDLLRPFMKESPAVGLDPDFMETPAFTDLANRVSVLFQKIGRLTTSFDYFAARVRDLAYQKEALDILTSIGYRMQSLTEARAVFELVFNAPHEDRFVRWVEATKKNVKFSYSPLEVGDFLSSTLFSRKDFTLFTSATLLVNGKFDYFKNSIGLFFAQSKGVVERQLLSPFDYKRQAEVYILDERVSHSSVSREKNDIIRELALMSEGGTLVLFTSYVRLQEVFQILRPEFEKAGLQSLKQGERPRDELLRMMKESPNVVLFATSSFWEGIDIQGDNLRCVIIEKIPFDSPSDPIYKAKVELLEKRGVNTFLSYSIPRAVLRLKQGMGRLIRSKSDKGVIAILDDRLITQRYGPIFLNSIPPAKLITGGKRQILLEAEHFFSSRF